MTIEDRIINEAARLGFCSAGFARVTPVQSAGIFQKWLDEGNNAGMDYLRKNERLRQNPANLAGGAVTAIVVAASYQVNNEPGIGFATYARGIDYHDVLRLKLDALAHFISSITKTRTARVCVDSAPVAERDLAIAAGIGWRGRQGQVVNPDFGCCLLLGELLTDIDLPPSAPLENGCGSCELCLKACPTGALQQDGLVDCRKCISYLTIEHKGDFSPQQAASLGGAVFGCDLCTAVCPWNRKTADRRIMPELAPRPTPAPGEIMAMTPAGFSSRFTHTPIARLGLDRLKRNASSAEPVRSRR
ncbi:MAG: tRNA epoxyqueuosine(34) reductase QueG [Verrucomicrobia bacterium]|nr:tRNA epoxyqueuosine(34) reductase QueG [Verrucomicrobiota bacterium]